MGDEIKYGMKLLDIDDAENGILAYGIDGGSIADEVAAIIWQRFDDAKAADKKIRLYAEMNAIPKISGKIVADKLKRLGTIFTTIERLAIVGDAGWMDVYARIVDPITKFDVKHFTSDQKVEAQTWLRGS